MKPSIICKHCQKGFIPSRLGAQKFCSTSCRVANFQMKKRINKAKSGPLGSTNAVVPKIDMTPKIKQGTTPIQSALINVSAIALNEGAKNLGIYQTKEIKLLNEVIERLNRIENKISINNSQSNRNNSGNSNFTPTILI